jgi:D-inositol-3-phosphate glycosyltransferase
MKKRLLWIGDAAVSSGFARATHHVLNALQEDWEILVLGLNYQGDPHSYPYPIFPCWPGGDAFGLGRTKQLVAELEPALVIVQNDPWNVPQYLKRIGDKVPVVAVCPVDGKNCRGAGLNGCTAVIFWTQFGLGEARAGGFTQPGYVIPLGVDRKIYRPTSRSEARSSLPKPLQEGFIVGNVNRNQPRKRLDLSVSYFAEWVLSKQIEDAFLYLHVAPTGDLGYDLIQLMEYYGLKKRLAIRVPDIGHGDMEDELAQAYSIFDIQINTGQGEGWGLTTLEGMACGIPQIVPRWSALGEWATAAIQVPCTEIAVTPNNVNVVGGIPDRYDFIDAMDRFYQEPELRRQHSDLGLTLAEQPRYDWTNIGEKFAAVLQTLPLEKVAC